MTLINPAIATILKAHNLSVTKQRALIFEQLEANQPQTMSQLYETVRNQVDRASLYRIIAVYEKLGIVHRINFGWKYKIELSDRYSEHHHHLTCVTCQAVTPINEVELETFINNLSSKHAFQPLEHQIEIQGYCQSCASKQ